MSRPQEERDALPPKVEEDIRAQAGGLWPETGYDARLVHPVRCSQTHVMRFGREAAAAGQPPTDRPGRRPSGALALVRTASAHSGLGGGRRLGPRGRRVRGAGAGPGARQGDGDARPDRRPRRFGSAGLRPEAMPLSTAWAPRGAAEVRRRLAGAALRRRPRDRAALCRADRRAPGVAATFRSSSSYATSGPATRRSTAAARLLRRLESWVVQDAAAAWSRSRPRRRMICGAVIRARASRRSRTASSRSCSRCARETSGTTIIHSGTLTKDRPLGPLLTSSAAAAPPRPARLRRAGDPRPRSTASGAEVEIVPPSGWEDAVARIAAADVALITQSRGAGDETAVAAKVYEYLALGKPVLCLSDGGATEALLRRLGADQLSARLGDDAVDRGRARSDHCRGASVAGAARKTCALRAPKAG